MAAEPVSRSAFEAHIQRLDAADAYRDVRLDSHIAEYRRDTARSDARIQEINAKVDGLDSKIDLLLDTQARVKGRDGVVIVVIGATISVLCSVIAALILGVL